MTRRRGWWIAGAAAIVIALAVGLWAWQASSRPATAEQAASAYLRALESGDPAAVKATGVDASAAALAAFAGASAYVDDARVAEVRESDTTATAEVSFRLADEQHTARLRMAVADGRWIVDESGMGTITASATTGEFVSVGGEPLPVDEDIEVIPAMYTVAAAPTRLLEGESEVTVLPAQRSDVEVAVTVRPEATEAAQAQLEEHLDACTAPAGTAPASTPPAGCGIRIPWGTEFRAVTDIAYRIERLPVIALAATEFTAADGVLVATVTGTGQDGAARTTTYRTDSWSVRGDVAFTDDDLVLSVW